MENRARCHVPLLKLLILPLWLVDSGPMAWGQCWSETAELKMGNPQNQDYFGSAVSIFGDTVVVGAPGDDNMNGDNAGSVRFFERDQGGPNSWRNLGTKISPNGNIGDQLGTSVSISGDTVAAGGIYAGPLGSGAVSVSERNLGGPDAWGESAS